MADGSLAGSGAVSLLGHIGSTHTVDCMLDVFFTPCMCVRMRFEKKKVACSQFVSLCSRTKPPLLICYAYDLHKKDRLEDFACRVK